MLRKMLMLLLAAMLLLSCACAEETENPFIGTWNALCVVSDGELYVPTEYDAPVTMVFTPDTLTIQQGEETEAYPCTYEDGICSYHTGMEIFHIAIGEDGLMRMYSGMLGSDYYAILSNAEEVVPDYISQFLGEWLVLATSNPEGLPDPRQTVIFTRAYIYSPMADEYTLCSYTEDGCIWYYEGEPFVTSTIDANGLMTATADYDNQTLWFVRVTPEPADQ